MPRSTDDILRHADELADRFESFAPSSTNDGTAAAIERLRLGAVARATAERQVRDAVAAARSTGVSWARIGALLGTSGEAARQRYATSVGAERGG